MQKVLLDIAKLQHTLDFQQPTGAMHRPPIGVEIGFRDPAFAVFAGVVSLWMNLRASRRNRINLSPQKPGEQTKPDQFQN